MREISSFGLASHRFNYGLLSKDVITSPRNDFECQHHLDLLGFLNVSVFNESAMFYVKLQLSKFFEEKYNKKLTQI